MPSKNSASPLTVAAVLPSMTASRKAQHVFSYVFYEHSSYVSVYSVRCPRLTLSRGMKSEFTLPSNGNGFRGSKSG